MERIRLAYFVSHPIQYQAPLLRRLAQERDIALTVFFCSGHSVQEYEDAGFGGVHVKWDTPLLDGYDFEFLPLIRRLRRGDPSFWRPINRGFYRKLKNGKFDAVWLHGYWSLNCISAMVAAKILGIPVLERAEGTLIDHDRSRLKLAVKRVFFAAIRHLIDAVLPISTRNREYWEHYFGADFPSFMVPYAVDNAYFRRAACLARDSREDFRKQLDLEPGRPVILFASKLMPRKRCMDLIDAYLRLRQPLDNRRPYLLIVGDGTGRAACEARAREAGYPDVRFLGFQNQSQLPRFYDLCDVFVLPSECEPFGLVVNEVMNAGRPIIVSGEVGCQPDLVIDGENGRVVSARNVEALASALDQLLGDAAQRGEMGRRCLERISQWSFEEDIRGLRQALHRVVGLN